MVQILTVSCKLTVPLPQEARLIILLEAFSGACNWIHANTPRYLTSKTAVQKLVYRDVRSLFGLSANLAIRAIARVCAARKAARLKDTIVKEFAPASVDYDARIFSLFERDWTVTLTLLEGRERIALDIGHWQKHLLSGQAPTSATLVRRNNGTYFLQIQIKVEPPQPIEPEDCLGVDLGRTDIAHTSTGNSFCSKHLHLVRDRYARVRASLQKNASKGTRSSRRRCRQLQKRLSGRERRFQQHTNHVISRRIADEARKRRWSIALEDLTGIRERLADQPRSKAEKRRANSWAFRQLRQFITYKSLSMGVLLVLISPAYTSQTCHRCHYLGKRQGKRFECGNCNWYGDADWNAACVISQMGRLVNSPRGPWLACAIGAPHRKANPRATSCRASESQ